VAAIITLGAVSSISGGPGGGRPVSGNWSGQKSACRKFHHIGNDKRASGKCPSDAWRPPSIGSFTPLIKRASYMQVVFLGAGIVTGTLQLPFDKCWSHQQLNSRLDSGFVTTLSPERMVRLCVARLRQKTARLCGLLTKMSIENPLRLRPPKATQLSRRVNHCFSLICAGAGRGSRTPKGRRPADFESAAYFG
jgi:hypothetical protein